MSTAQAKAPSVLTFNDRDFSEACAALMQQVRREWRPDALVGVRTGGVWVAERMARAAGYDLPVLPVTCRRPSTRQKAGSSTFRKLAAELPRPVLDGLRVIEHRVMTFRPAAAAAGTYQFDTGELAALDGWLAAAAPPPRLLVVDDSVDTGTTLFHVLDMLRKRAPAASDVRAAAITVTTQRPRAMPDYALLTRQLCRFPWSFDSRS